MPTQEADGNGNVTTTGYNTTWRFPLTVTNARSQVTTYTYETTFGQVSSVTGPNTGSTTSYEYDTFGRLTKVIRPGDTSAVPTLKYEYGTYRASPYRPLPITTTAIFTTSTGNLATPPEVRYYDGLGRLVQESKQATSGEWQVANTDYNAQGLKLYAYTPYTTTVAGFITPTTQAKTTFAYDALARPTTTSNTDNSTVRTFYDGFQTATIDEKSHQKIAENDVFGRTIKVKEFTGTYGTVSWSATPYATTNYAYNQLDLLTTVTDAQNNVTTMTYDAMGRKKTMSDPDMGTWDYDCDNASNLIRQTDALTPTRTITCFCYDALNRLTGKDYGGDGNCSTLSGVEVQYTYDSTTGGNRGLGYRTGMTDPSGSTNWKYDARGRVIGETKVINGTGGGTFWTQWTYNARDQIVTQTYPGGSNGTAGEVVTTAYGRWGQPVTLTGAASYVAKAFPNAAGQIDYIKLGGTDPSPTLIVDYVYYPWTTANGRGRLQQIKAGPPANPSAREDLTYSYDPVGNITSIQVANPTPAETQNYTYDDLDRLLSVTSPYSQSYTYTEIGNLATRTTGAGTASCGYASNHKHAVNTIKGTTSSTNKTVTVWARGNNAGGAWPQIKLRINGVEYGPWTVGTSSWASYGTTTATLTGQDIVNVIYINDVGASQVDVDYVVVDGVTTHTETGAMVYDRGDGSAALDGLDVVPGGQTMDVNGALRFVRGTAAFAYGYDQNGNLTYRCVQDKGYVFSRDPEGRITGVSGAATAAFTYDGDGNRVKGTVNGVTTCYVGDYYEVTGAAARKYYYHWGKRVAMNDNGTLYWLLTDHLGSTAVVANGGTGAWAGELRYRAWGQTRSETGTVPIA